MSKQGTKVSRVVAIDPGYNGDAPGIPSPTFQRLNSPLITATNVDAFLAPGLEKVRRVVAMDPPVNPGGDWTVHFASVDGTTAERLEDRIAGNGKPKPSFPKALMAEGKRGNFTIGRERVLYGGEFEGYEEPEEAKLEGHSVQAKLDYLDSAAKHMTQGECERLRKMVIDGLDVSLPVWKGIVNLTEETSEEINSLKAKLNVAGLKLFEVRNAAKEGQ